jgi:hypothetical protein
LRGGGETVQTESPAVKLSEGRGAVGSVELSCLAIQGKLWAGITQGSSRGTRGRRSSVLVATSRGTGDAGKEGVTIRVTVPVGWWGERGRGS